VSHDLAGTLDILPTCVTLAGGTAPNDPPIDGVDLSPVLLGTGESPRSHMLYYRGRMLMAARLGEWKAHFITQDAYGPNSKQPTRHDPPLLYNLEHDPSEARDVAAAHPDVIAEIRALVDKHTSELVAPPSQLDATLPQ
jgi:arylsulfatase A-like enzyme